MNGVKVLKVKNTIFFVQEWIFKEKFLGDEKVFENSTPYTQLVHSEACIRNRTEIIKCRYDLQEIIEYFLNNKMKEVLDAQPI